MAGRKPSVEVADEAALLRRMVGDVDAFATTSWGRRPHRHHEPSGFGDLLSVEAVDVLLESARRPGFRVVTEGRTLSPSEYTKTVRMGGTSLDDAASRNRIAGLFDGGATLVMQGLERTHEPLRRFTRQLACELGHNVQANAYLSPGAGARGLGRHADQHDVFVLQVEGDKRWDVEGLGEVTLQPGDVLYMPRGTPHSAHTDGSPSLHVTIGVSALTYRDVLRRAIDSIAAGDGSALDQRLPPGFARVDGDGELRQGIENAVRELTDHLQQLQPEAVAAGERRRVRARSTPSRSLRTAFDAAAVTPSTSVRAIRSRPITVSTECDEVIVDLDDRRIRMPLAALAAVQHLVGHPSATVGELPGLSDQSRVVVVRRLIKEGALEVVAGDDV
jgi:lysine-specific demethylase/histidyl-hydroxylase NO66